MLRPVPLTFFAHQAPVIPLKVARPRWFDGTALCIGAAAPDLGYPISGWVTDHSHTPMGVVTWSLAITVVLCALMRRHVATTAFAQLPDCGPLRLNSLRVLARRRPPPWQTATSALLGAASHLLLDAFTHEGRFGARLLHIESELFTVQGHAFSGARVLQYVGHTFGSLLGALLLVRLARTRRLEAWYGDDAVRDARSFRLTPAARVAFWAIVALGVPVGAAWAGLTDQWIVFPVIDATLAATVVACLSPRTRPQSARPGESERPQRARPTEPEPVREVGAMARTSLTRTPRGGG
jgi:hypothetical protein